MTEPPIDVDSDDAEAIGVHQDEIKDGYNAYEWLSQRAAYFLTPCSGFIVGKRHVITAAHCGISSDSSIPVRFFLDGVPREDLERTKRSVTLPPGVSWTDKINSSDLFEDIVLVELTEDIPSTSRVARMAHPYPGSDVYAKAVGNGRHDDMSNPDHILKYVGTYTRSDSDSHGNFLVQAEVADSGDSGGPLYVHGEVLGALSGSTFDWGMRDQYTSLSRHLTWILNQMNYAGPFNVYDGFTSSGRVLESFYTASSRVCAYACDKRTDCGAYTFGVRSSTMPVPECRLHEPTSEAPPFTSPLATGIKLGLKSEQTQW